jgi:hypothetical protein
MRGIVVGPMNPIARHLRDLRLLPYWIALVVVYSIVALMAFSLIGGEIALTLVAVGMALWFAGWLIISYPFYAGMVGLLIGAIAFRQWVRSREDVTAPPESSSASAA